MNESLSAKTDLFIKKYCIYLKDWDRQACANSVDPDQMLHNAASTMGPHCLTFNPQFFLNTSTGSKMDINPGLGKTGKIVGLDRN